MSERGCWDVVDGDRTVVRIEEEFASWIFWFAIS